MPSPHKIAGAQHFFGVFCLVSWLVHYSLFQSRSLISKSRRNLHRATPEDTAPAFLTHFFGRGLADKEYLISRFQAMANGDIPQVLPEAPKAKGRRRVKRATAILTGVTVADILVAGRCAGLLTTAPPGNAANRQTGNESLTALTGQKDQLSAPLDDHRHSEDTRPGPRTATHQLRSRSRTSPQAPSRTSHRAVARAVAAGPTAVGRRGAGPAIFIHERRFVRPVDLDTAAQVELAGNCGSPR